MASPHGSSSPPLRGRLLGAAFELLYHSRTLYWLASTIPFAGQWRVWQRRVLPRITGSDVLEIGCGIGTLLADLVAAGFRCRAVDASPQMVAATRAELRRRHLLARDVQVIQARVQALPFPDASFDTVVSTFPTPYIYDPAAIREIARVLRPGGRLVVVEAATLQPANLLVRPLVAFQSLVYGHPISRSARSWTAPPLPSSPGAIQTIDLPDSHSAIPLAAAGLVGRRQCDRTPLWVVYVILGDKPPVATSPS